MNGLIAIGFKGKPLCILDASYISLDGVEQHGNTNKAGATEEEKAEVTGTIWTMVFTDLSLRNVAVIYKSEAAATAEYENIHKAIDAGKRIYTIERSKIK